MKPWMQTTYMVVIAAAIMGMSIAVWILNRDTADDLLATIGFLGGLAVLLNAIFTRSNGNGSNSGSH